MKHIIKYQLFENTNNIEELKVKLLDVIKNNIESVSNVYKEYFKEALNKDPNLVVDTIIDQVGDDFNVGKQMFGRKIAKLAWDIGLLIKNKETFRPDILP